MIPQKAHQVILHKQHLWLWPQKVVFWEEKNMLLVTDLHLGKSGHFRSRGIPVPKEINQSNLDILSMLIGSTSAGRLVILGDLFHSQINKEWIQFKDWRALHPGLEITLVEGNHDILAPKYYKSAGIILHEQLSIPPFLLVHDVQSMNTDATQQLYTLSGHIHPAVRLKGKGRQMIKLPCFYFGARQGILPAFGAFTGTHVINPDMGDRIYVVTNQQIIPL